MKYKLYGVFISHVALLEKVTRCLEPDIRAKSQKVVCCLRITYEI